ncbi:MAG: Rrf2 family transcriptional regulator [Planctomycetes bacterium]|jgi:Rrf2 family nitric oxide-sensitive transcriptional repressor|nr:Rrf2 family transcriptional regulator [Planctomycetota bacterium]
MKLSLFSDYALRTLMYAALKDDTVQIDEITAAYGISRHHLSKIVQFLGQQGYLETQRGRGGGMRLGRKPGDIRLGALVRQTEDQSAIVECFDPATNTCPLNGCCALKRALAEALAAFYASLDRLTLSDLVSGPQRSAMQRILLGGRTS